MFERDPSFLKETQETHTNCKRFAVKVWEAIGLDIPKKFKEEHVDWLKDNWFDNEGKPITNA